MGLYILCTVFYNCSQKKLTAAKWNRDKLTLGNGVILYVLSDKWDMEFSLYQQLLHEENTIVNASTCITDLSSIDKIHPTVSHNDLLRCVTYCYHDSMWGICYLNLVLPSLFI